MSEPIPLKEPLEDSIELTKRAHNAGITFDQAKAFLGELADVSLNQIARFILAIHRERTRAAQTAERKKDRR